MSVDDDTDIEKALKVVDNFTQDSETNSSINTGDHEDNIQPDKLLKNPVQFDYYRANEVENNDYV